MSFSPCFMWLSRKNKEIPCLRNVDPKFHGISNARLRQIHVKLRHGFWPRSDFGEKPPTRESKRTSSRFLEFVSPYQLVYLRQPSQRIFLGQHFSGPQLSFQHSFRSSSPCLKIGDTKHLIGHGDLILG